jgi:hypothetical protein
MSPRNGAKAPSGNGSKGAKADKKGKDEYHVAPKKESIPIASKPKKTQIPK